MVFKNPSQLPCMQLLLGKQESDALMYLRKWLREAVRKEGLQAPKTKSRPGDMHYYATIK